MKKANKCTQSVIGAYGEWAANLVGQGPALLSFRNPEFKSVDTWRTDARAKMAELLAAPQDVWQPKAKVEESVIHDGLKFERLSWQLPYGARTAAVFIKPANAKGRLPAVLGLHDHAGNKYFGYRKIVRLPERQHTLMRAHQKHYYEGAAWANELARRGYGVLVHDAFAFGSRRVLFDDVPKNVAAGNTEPKNPEAPSRIKIYNEWAAKHAHTLAKSLFCAGTTWPGVFLYEDQKALDYLCTRNDVDVERIGCAGLSGGGLRTVMLAGMDDRIKVAVPVGFMSTWRDFLLYKSHTHTWMRYVPLLPRYLDFPEVLGLRAPLPTLVLNDSDDALYTPEGMHEADNILREVYKKAGAPQNYVCSFHPGPHKFDKPMQEEAFAWFDKWLR